jgi:hypothetical protein
MMSMPGIRSMTARFVTQLIHLAVILLSLFNHHAYTMDEIGIDLKLQVSRETLMQSDTS